MRALLELHGVSRAFQSLMAVNNVDLSVQEGELLGVIGPNGAGKSTLYNTVAGVLRPTAGRVIFNGEDITGRKPYDVARIGLARTFQIPKPYRQLSVIENVMVTAFLRDHTIAGARRIAEQVVDDIGLTPYVETPVGALTVGLLKRLEVARAMAGKPKLVLFDEIMAGLTPAEVGVMTKYVASLPARGVTVLWVEHVLYAIMKTATRIVVLNRGALIAQGAPAQIARDPAVVKAYLGEEMDLA